MVIIKTTCPSCGEVDLTADKVELRVAIGGEGSSYAFDCPRCTDRVRKPADARVVQLLISGGVAPEILPAPEPVSGSVPGPVSGHLLGPAEAARAAHPSSHRGAAGGMAPAFTYDDLIEFHKELEAGVLENYLRNTAA